MSFIMSKMWDLVDSWTLSKVSLVKQINISKKSLIKTVKFNNN